MVYNLLARGIIAGIDETKPEILEVILIKMGLTSETAIAELIEALIQGRIATIFGYTALPLPYEKEVEFSSYSSNSSSSTVILASQKKEKKGECRVIEVFTAKKS